MPIKSPALGLSELSQRRGKPSIIYGLVHYGQRLLCSHSTGRLYLAQLSSVTRPMKLYFFLFFVVCYSVQIVGLSVRAYGSPSLDCYIVIGSQSTVFPLFLDPPSLFPLDSSKGEMLSQVERNYNRMFNTGQLL